MKVLVAYASKHGSTRGIARFIGEKLRQCGLDTDVLEVAQVQNLWGYDAFVIGSALYMGHWMKEAKQFVSRNYSALSSRPVWLFSSGPTGKERNNTRGQDFLDPTVSGPLDLDRIEKGLQVKSHRIFFGAFDPKDLDFFSRQFFKSAAVRNATPTGDFRDWSDIEGWTMGIVHSLQQRIPQPAGR